MRSMTPKLSSENELEAVNRELNAVQEKSSVLIGQIAVLEQSEKIDSARKLIQSIDATLHKLTSKLERDMQLIKEMGVQEGVEEEKVKLDVEIERNKLIKKQQEGIIEKAEAVRKQNEQCPGVLPLPEGATLENLRVLQNEIDKQQRALVQRKRELEDNDLTIEDQSGDLQKYQLALNEFKNVVAQRYQVASNMLDNFDGKAAAIEKAGKDDPSFDLNWCTTILKKATALVKENHPNPKIELAKFAGFKTSSCQKEYGILLAFLGAVATLVSALTLPPLYTVGVAAVSFFGCAAMILSSRKTTMEKMADFVLDETEAAARQAASFN